MTTIVLKDRNSADVPFTLTSVSGNGMVFDNRTGALLNRKRLTLSLNESQKTNRVRAKLSVPSVATVDGIPVITYTQVASCDISVVTFASEDDRADLQAMFSSLTATPAVKNMVERGILPNT